MIGLGRFLLLSASLIAPLVEATTPVLTDLASRQEASWWLGSIKSQGNVPGNTAYKVFRNVKDFGAKGDGVTDDSAAINRAISEDTTTAGRTERCGNGCNSTTTQPAIVFFPSGTYLVKKPIIQYYLTQLVGDAVSLPTIKADPSLEAMGMIDADPYRPDGSNWYTNQNNFFRQIRNFNLDLTGRTNPTDGLAAIHWQVAQATSLTNINFKMTRGSQQKGIFMDNGSGGLLADLTFDGGLFGAFLGNQQFTSINLKFTNTDTAIFMNWNWLWTLKSIDIDNTNKFALNMSVGGSTSQTVGSVLILDSKLSASQANVVTAFDIAQKQSNGTLVLDNVQFGSGNTVVNENGVPVPNSPPAGLVTSWVQGSTYTTGTTESSPSGQKWFQNTLPNGPTRPASLLSGNKIAEVSKPQYEKVSASNIISVKDRNVKGDGVTDDTAALQAVFDSITPDQVLFFPHGHYLLKDTLKITKSVNVVGEVWPVLLADGQSFNDESNPKVVIQVGDKANPGINIQMSDLVISTNGPAKGAILMEWNVRGDGTPGSAGLWDVHWRIAGFEGTNLQSDNCARAAPGAAQEVKEECYAAFLMFHMTEKASGMFVNVWWWVADHELSLPGEAQINVWQGRGVLIESQGPTWLYGTASEHSQLYNYVFNKAKNVFIGAVQTETAYMHGGAGSVDPTKIFKPNPAYSDPDFSECTDASDVSCKMTWGFRFIDSSDILVYGAGLYSFFNNYKQTCLKSGGGSDNCQRNMVFTDDCSADIAFFGLSTKAAVNMVTFGNSPDGILGAENPSTFCDTAALVEIA